MAQKKPNKVLSIIVIVLLVLFLGRNIFIKAAAQIGVKAVTGLPLHIGSFKTGLFSTNIAIRNFELKNPKGFKEPVMVNIPEIYVDYSLLPMLTGKIDLKEIRFHLANFVVVQRADGTSNLDTLKALQQQGGKKTEPAPEKKEKKAGKSKEVKIDNLTLKIDKVTYIKYDESGQPKVKEYNIGIDESYSNIKNLNAVVALIVFKSLAKTPIALANIDLGSLGDTLSGTLGTATKVLGSTAQTATKALGTTKETATKTMDEAKDKLNESADKLKGLLKFGK